MLIIPLHKTLDRHTWPWMTVALVLVNLAVFVFLQGGDGARLERAAQTYRSAGLAEREAPAIAQALAASGQQDQADWLGDLPEPQRSRMLVEVLAMTPPIERELSAIAARAAADDPGALWPRQRAAVERELASLVTPRYLHRYDAPWGIGFYTSIFLHADIGHLLGNMVFLMLLGLMTEGALGRRTFLLVYLLAGLGGNALAGLLHAGSSGGALGASGAIAGLMGVLAVIWGMRQVRVFWWFFIAFGYRTVPAIFLLPCWLGWELWNYVMNPELGIGFDAHAGGMMTGALLAAAVRIAGRERRGFLDAEVLTGRRAELVVGLRRAIGQLDFASAEALADELTAIDDPDRESLELILRAQQAREGSARWQAAVRALLALPANSPADAHSQSRAIARWLELAPAPDSADQRLIDAVLTRSIAVGALDLASQLLDRLRCGQALSAARAPLAFRLLLRWRDVGNLEAALALEEALLNDLPQSVEAAKIRRQRALAANR